MNALCTITMLWFLIKATCLNLDSSYTAIYLIICHSSMWFYNNFTCHTNLCSDSVLSYWHLYTFICLYCTSNVLQINRSEYSGVFDQRFFCSQEVTRFVQYNISSRISKISVSWEMIHEVEEDCSNECYVLCDAKCVM